MWLKIKEFSELTSTNTYSLENLAELSHGDVVWAQKQTAGRGRQGRAWLSEEGKCLTFSIVLKENLRADNQFFYTQVLSLALHRTLEKVGISKSWIKWPNDVYVGSAKIAGILCEASFSGNSCEGLILGLGLNVNLVAGDLVEVDQELSSLRIALNDDEDFDLRQVLSVYLNEFRLLLDEAFNNLETFHEGWFEKTQLKDRQVRLEQGANILEGYVKEILPNGILQLMTNNGLEEILCGDMSLRIVN